MLKTAFFHLNLKEKIENTLKHTLKLEIIFYGS